MGHHSDQPPEFMRRKMDELAFDADRLAEMKREIADAKDDDGKARVLRRQLLDTTRMVGGTGEHPEGFLTPDDEGGIQFRVGSENGKVVLDFGKPVHWVGMDAQQAADLASSLLKWARIVGRKEGVTIALNLNAN